MLSAILNKIVGMVMTWAVRYITDHITAWMERRRAREEQARRDAENKPGYDGAIQNGSSEDIADATEDYLNGKP